MHTFRPENGDVQIERGRTVKFAHVGSQFPVARVAVEYRNPGPDARMAELRVNDGIATKILFPVTGKAFKTVWLETSLSAGGENVLKFSSECSAGPEIALIRMQ